MSRNPNSKSASSQSCPGALQHPPKRKGDICTQRAAGSLQPGADFYLDQAEELIAAQLDLKPGFTFSFLIFCLGCRNLLKKCALAQLLLEPGLTFSMKIFTIKWNFIIFLHPVRFMRSLLICFFEMVTEGVQKLGIGINFWSWKTENQSENYALKRTNFKNKKSKMCLGGAFMKYDRSPKYVTFIFTTL